MPINTYTCSYCGAVEELITTKISDVVEKLICPHCSETMIKDLCCANLRMGKLFTAGGPAIQDKDGYESLGMTGDAAEKSAKMRSDHEQLMRDKGMSSFTAAVQMSPSREMTDEEVYIASHEKEKAIKVPIVSEE